MKGAAFTDEQYKRHTYKKKGSVSWKLNVESMCPVPRSNKPQTPILVRWIAGLIYLKSYIGWRYYIYHLLSFILLYSRPLFSAVQNTLFTTICLPLL